MEYHGLTDQFSKMFFMSSLKGKAWSELAQKQMAKDFGEDLNAYLETELPTLKHLKINKIAGKPVNVHSSVYYDHGAYITVKDKFLKVSSIGRTFLDMIRTPNLCGGIYHVLDVYRENAKRYLRLIIDETDRNGSLIDKTRVGYILDERLGLSEPRIEEWKRHVQRGGSRKLVADGDYSPFFSETWCLSINIEESLD
jgi:predicted transcriptional regulator of viral defense system